MDLSEIEVSEQTDNFGLVALSTGTIRERRMQLAQAEEHRQEHGRELRSITLPNEPREETQELLDPLQVVGFVIQLVRNF